MQKFLVVSAGMSPETVSIIMTTALVCFMACQPLFGMLADRIGVKAHMLLFSGLAALLVVPILYALKSVTSPYAAFGLVVSGLVIASFYTPISGLVKADLYPLPCCAGRRISIRDRQRPVRRNRRVCGTLAAVRRR